MRAISTPMSDTEFDRKPNDKAKTGAPLLPCYDDLSASCAYGWSMLERGVKDRKSAFHTPSIATITATGSPTIRTVVLRGCATEDKTLRFHTDTRSGKIAELQENPLPPCIFMMPVRKYNCASPCGWKYCRATLLTQHGKRHDR